MANGPQNSLVDFDGNPDHITLGLGVRVRVELGLQLTFHVIAIRTMPQLGEGQVVRTTHLFCAYQHV